MEYLVSFIRTKIDKVDESKKRVAEEEDEEEMDIPSTTTTSSGPLAHSYLRAPEKEEKPLSELLKTATFLIPNLANMLGVFVNNLRTREESYYRVQKEHIVNGFTPFRNIRS